MCIPPPLQPSPPNLHVLMHTHTHTKAETGFPFSTQLFHQRLFKFLLQIHNLLLISPRILRKNNCYNKEKKLWAMRDTVVMFEGKKASGFRKPKQRLKPIASPEYEEHLLKTKS